MSTSMSVRGLLTAGVAALVAASPASAATIGNAELVQRTSNASLLCWDNPFAGQATADTFLVREAYTSGTPASGPLTGGTLSDPARRLGNPLRDSRLCAVVSGQGASDRSFQVETAGTGGRSVLTSDVVSQRSAVPIDDITQPSITSVSPDAGSAAGGDTVTITGDFGHAFDGTSPVSGAVYFAGSPYPAELVSGSASAVVVKAPSSQTTGPGQVLVFGRNGVSDGVTGAGEPPVYDVLPAAPSAILGFRVDYQGSKGAILCWDKPAGRPGSDYELQQSFGVNGWGVLKSDPIGRPGETRACAGRHGEFFQSRVVRVASTVDPSQASAPITLQFGPPPIGRPVPLTAVTPASGPPEGGTRVTLSGDFANSAGSFPEIGRVWFSSSTAPVRVASATPTALEVESPKGAPSSTASIITANGYDYTVAPAAFAYTEGAAPTITGLATDFVGFGASVVCWDNVLHRAATGYRLQSQAPDGTWSELADSPIGGASDARSCAAFHHVSFDGVQRNVVRAVSAADPAQTSAALTVDALPPDPVSSRAPSITAVTPASGLSSGGTTVTLTGNFGERPPISRTRVYLSTSATPATLVSLTGDTAVITTPKGAAGAVADIVFVTGNDFSVTPAAFRYVDGGPIAQPLRYAVAGQAALKTLTRGTLPLTGTTDLTLTPATGAISGALDLAPAKASLVALGFLPVKATVAFAALGPATGALTDAGLTVAEKARIRLSNVSLFGLTLVGTTSTCQTRNPTNIALRSPGAFDRLVGGTLAGTFTIGDLTGCGSLSGLVSSLTAGGGNTLALKLTPVQ